MKKLTGKEARYILHQRRVNLRELAEKLGITPQTFNSRLNANLFSEGRQMEINKALGVDVFEVDSAIMDRQPVLDIRASAGMGIELEGDENSIVEYVSVPSMNGCIGITVYGDSMMPRYCAGDIVFVRPNPEVNEIEYGRPYLIITKTARYLKNIYEGKDDTSLRLNSINADVNEQGDRLYPDYAMPKENILYLYKVVGSLRREQI